MDDSYDKKDLALMGLSLAMVQTALEEIADPKSSESLSMQLDWLGGRGHVVPPANALSIESICRRIADYCADASPDVLIALENLSDDCFPSFSDTFFEPSAWLANIQCAAERFQAVPPSLKKVYCDPMSDFLGTLAVTVELERHQQPGIEIPLEGASPTLDSSTPEDEPPIPPSTPPLGNGPS